MPDGRPAIDAELAGELIAREFSRLRGLSVPDAGLAIFDLDGTLVDQDAAVRCWVGEFIAEHDLEPGLSSWLVTQLTARMPKDQVFATIAERTHLALHPDALWGQYRSRMPSLAVLFPGVDESLRALRGAGWTLGIATNGMPDNQGGKIRRTGLNGLVDGWVTSGEVGLRKPDPRLLAVLAERLGVPLQGWMVGDGLESDVAAGRAAGLRTAWVSVAGHPVSSADLTVPDVATFAAYLLSR